MLSWLSQVKAGLYTSCALWCLLCNAGIAADWQSITLIVKYSQKNGKRRPRWCWLTLCSDRNQLAAENEAA